MKKLVILLSLLLSCLATHAQIVTIPIPGSPLSLNVMANPQPLQNIQNNPASVGYQLWDDGYANVPLPFNFPFFDKTFNNSTMYSNGAVQFGPPVVGFPSNNTFCCNGITIDRSTPAAYNYSILMMQTDMYGSTGTNHYSLGTATNMTYGWYGVERLGDPTNKTSFELKIDSTGGIDMRWTGALITMNTPAIGIIGDASKGEFAIIQQGSLNQNYIIPGLTQWTTGQTPDIVLDPCTTNPLFSQTCGGYQAAYLIQQCSADPLYATTCSGYQAAYTNQQCAVSSLYSPSCSGYSDAYHAQQCSLDSLYMTDCPGYASAYLNLQCSLNPLYSTTCTGYATAYKTQQCTASPLYATDCPGYEQAYLNDRCIIDSLYSNKCEGYATAYTIKYLVTNIDSTAVNASLSQTAATKANDPTNVVVATNTASTTISSDGSVSTGVSATGDTNVDKAIAVKNTSASGSSPAAPVQLTAPPPAPAMAQRQEQKQDEKKSDNKPEPNDKPADKPNAPPQQAQSNESGGSKPAAPTARQEIQAKRQEAARAKAVEAGKNLGETMGKAADMEAQKVVQNVVIQAMGFTPGFDAYGKSTIQDAAGYKPFSVYNNQKTIDSRANLRMFGGADRIHNEMVESQYNKEK